MRRLLLLFPLLIPACTLNPAFDPAPGESGEPASTGPALPTTSSGETLEPDLISGTTHADTGTTAADETTATLTSSIDPTTGGTSTSTGTDTTGDTGTDSESTDPESCWDLPPESWQAKLTVLDGFEDLGPHDPVIAPDGLSLVYIANSDFRPFRTKRAARTDPFLNGTPITMWGAMPTFVAGYPRFSLADQELLVSYDHDVYFAKFKIGDMFDQYTLPALLSGAVNTGKEENLTIVEDGTTLIVQRDDSLPMQPFPGNRRFYQFTRVAPQPGDPFLNGQDFTPYVGPHGFALCPALSPDGLRLLFASTDAPVFTEMNVADVVQVFYTTRDTLTSGWDPPVRLDAITPGGAVLCPTSVTADGCALTYVKFEYGRFTDQPYTMYLLERTP